MGELVLTLKDNTGDKKQFSFTMPDMTGVNFATVDGYHDSLSAAVLGVTLGTLQDEKRLYQRTYNPNVAPPAESEAQTNLRWVIEAFDAVVGKSWKWFIPTADIRTATGLLLPNSEQHDPAAAGWVAFKAAFNQAVLSPDGNAVTITSIYYEGK